ncbi:hypothetical protein WMY93_033313 [Mugilogobius chulae]|uniref:T-box domain-containing protein n=1 Tax=Mugilogobius chulae TaxID=88201 RepID=A0AAW0ML31_9GOBI
MCSVHGRCLRRTRGGQAESKRWAMLFCCMSSRAVHIETIASLDTTSCINALRRFFAILDLQADTIRLRNKLCAAAKELGLSLKEPNGAMQKFLSEQNFGVPPPQGQFTNKDLYSKQWRQVQALADEFWRRWRQEYLPTLQMRRKWKETKRDVREGDIVLLRDNQAARNKWPMAKITAVFPGRMEESGKFNSKCQIKRQKQRREPCPRGFSPDLARNTDFHVATSKPALSSTQRKEPAAPAGGAVGPQEAVDVSVLLMAQTQRREMVLFQEDASGLAPPAAAHRRGEDGGKSDPWPPDCVLRGIRVTLENNSMWSVFYPTEMIVTKEGKRMFPYFRFRLSGLNPNKKYSLLMDLQPADTHRYSWSGRGWQVCGVARNHIRSPPFAHPDSPASGQHWMQNTVSFYRLKLTSDAEDKSGNTALHLHQRYLPRLHLSQTDRSKDLKLSAPGVLTFTFPQTEFIAVSAYQNPRFLKLKVKYNPFAKGLKEETPAKGLQVNSKEPTPEQNPLKKNLKSLLANHKLKTSKASEPKPEARDCPKALERTKSSSGHHKSSSEPPKTSSSDQPWSSSDQPKSSSDQPRFSSDQPRFSSDQPRFSSDQPRFSSDQPRFSSDQPRFSSDQPKSSSDQPRFSSDQPRSSSDQPRFSSDQPRFSSDQPRSSSDQPRFSSDQPRSSSDPPRFSSTDRSKSGSRDQSKASAKAQTEEIW